MQLKAIIQAALLVFLLAISWILLVHRLEKNARPETTEPTPHTEEAAPAPPEPTEAEEEERASLPASEQRALVAEDWHEWWDYLEAQESPQGMRTALGELRDLVRGLPQELARDWIMAFLNSGADMRTGLAFQVQGDGRLRGTASLRAYLLDLLQMVDPVLAGKLAEDELRRLGTGLVPDVYVIHMRNYARNPEWTRAETMPFLQDRFGDLIREKAWMTRPTTALAEAMDVAVYTRAVEYVPELERLIDKHQPQLLRHASSLALERLVDREPMKTLNALLDTIPDSPDLAAARAGYFARLDPSLPGAPELLQAYLETPGLPRSEAVRFLESFPNLNRSYSYNLLSTDNFNTEPVDYVDRIQNAVLQIEAWQKEDTFPLLGEALEQARIRMLAQLGGEPAP